MPSGLRDLYLPKNLDTMVEHWILLIRLSRILGKTLSFFYQQLGTQPTLLQFDNLESELSTLTIPEFLSTQSPLATFSYYHLQLHLQ